MISRCNIEEHSFSKAELLASIALVQAASPAGPSGRPNNVSGSTAKMGKDPTVATDFLPDRERERVEEDLRRKLRQEYELRQQV